MDYMLLYLYLAIGTAAAAFIGMYEKWINPGREKDNE